MVAFRPGRMSAMSRGNTFASTISWSSTGTTCRSSSPARKTPPSVVNFTFLTMPLAGELTTELASCWRFCVACCSTCS